MRALAFLLVARLLSRKVPGDQERIYRSYAFSPSSCGFGYCQEGTRSKGYLLGSGPVLMTLSESSPGSTGAI